jgi:hypothetical protein
VANSFYELENENMSPQRSIKNKIIESLPSGYGEVLCNFDIIRNDIYIGIVVPSYLREKYLSRCLNTLAKSNLPHTAICFIDESDASYTRTQEGFVTLYDVDSGGKDIMRIDADKETVYREAIANPRCVAFNDIGFLKYEVNPPSRLRRFEGTKLNLYVRKSFYNNHSEYQKFTIPPKRQVSTNRSLIMSFSHNIPVIKIFKNTHGNVHDSLRTGWDLLLSLFGCGYLCNLDSDMIVKPHWLTEITLLHEIVARIYTKLPVIVSGFNTPSHPVSKTYDLFYLKRTIGGANLFFNREVYKNILRPSLETILWDWLACNSMRKQEGVIAVSRKSVAQHIGKKGIWSKPLRHDKARQF